MKSSLLHPPLFVSPSVPCRDVHGRSLSQPSSPDCWSSAGSVSPGSAHCSADQFSVKPRSPTPELHGDTEGTA